MVGTDEGTIVGRELDKVVGETVGETIGEMEGETAGKRLGEEFGIDIDGVVIGLAAGSKGGTSEGAEGTEEVGAKGSFPFPFSFSPFFFIGKTMIMKIERRTAAVITASHTNLFFLLRPLSDGMFVFFFISWPNCFDESSLILFAMTSFENESSGLYWIRSFRSLSLMDIRLRMIVFA